MSYLWYWPDNNPDSWHFERWRQAQTWQPVRSEQSGQADPLPLLPEDGTLEQWRTELAPHWRAISEEVLGRLADVPPSSASGPTGDLAMGPELRTDAYTMQRYRYPLTDDEAGYGWLLTPHQPVTDAAVIALHPTTPVGKDQSVGLDETDVPTTGGSYARELAERGYPVFAPDAIAFGERQAASKKAKYPHATAFFGAQPEASVMGKMAFDTTRAGDFLARRGHPRLAMIGHSHGAYGALFGMLADERVLTAAMSCGFNLLRDDPRPRRWWEQTAMMPRLGLYASIADTPIDYHHWLALAAPRPILVTFGSQDHIYPEGDRLAPRLEEVRRVYAAHGVPDDLIVAGHDGGHRFTPEIREASYSMFDRVFGV